ncbi:SDR family NAD(P)-dependent oxidoreductase [Bauldia litoralis]|uniref:Enoyl-[acyl-carrier-protein] reductase [NADH] n=1 Tax=Bauldia litoralis TaxID=665467 RepID=A0A1G6CAB2_9HYPH|nr:SDR family NAD(P)-dependent oxidoreductase [Bauldia litoralis]SDB29828.1 Enoyl-[acyl-carrier-protein] reductase [NADH] [Bauldia litoralis]
MKISAEGKTALIVNGQGKVGQAIAAALTASGATVVEATAGGLDLSSQAAATRSAPAVADSPFLLIHVSAGLNSTDRAPDGSAPSELDRFAFAARAFAPQVARIVHVISAAGVVPLRGDAAFSAAQAGLASLTRALAMELAPDVVVNALAVGAVDDADERLVSHSPLKRAATPAEIANAALFLADPANTYTTGHVMTVDGGWSIGYARDF